MALTCRVRSSGGLILFINIPLIVTLYLSNPLPFYIFEIIIFNQINDHFTSHDLYYNGQYGFREKHSTQLAALELIVRITHELDMGNTPINIFIDLSKAADTLDHAILISKLQHYGITGAALQLLVSYLSNRKQFVQYGDLLSQKTDILMGVPQGSILGPLLFIIYINDMVHSSELFKFINFADDTTPNFPKP